MLDEDENRNEEAPAPKTPPRLTVVTPELAAKVVDDGRIHFCANAPQHVVAAQLEAALLLSGNAARSPDGRLVRVDGELRLVPMTVGDCVSEVSRWAHAYTMGKDGSHLAKYFTAFAPEIKTLMHRTAGNTLPIARGVARAPLLLEDGRVLQTPGLDLATGIYFAPFRSDYRTVSTDPTEAEVEEAKTIVGHLFDGATFADDTSKAVAIAHALTLVVCYGLRPVPAFVFASADQLSGKTTCAIMAQYYALGEAEHRNFPKTGNVEYAIGAIIKDGPKGCLLDNPPDGSEIGSGELASILTAHGSWSTRNISTSDSIRGHVPVLSIAALNPDLSLIERRAVLARFNANDSRGGVTPEVRARRGHGDANWALLTLLVRFLVLDRPAHGKKIKASFERWDRLVRGACIYFGFGDPEANADAIKDQAQDQDARKAIIIEIWRATEAAGRPLRAVDILTAAGGEHGSDVGDPALRAALRAIAPTDRQLNAMTVGRGLARYLGRPWRGCAIGAVTRDGYKQWRIDGDLEAAFLAAGERPPEVKRIEVALPKPKANLDKQLARARELKSLEESMKFAGTWIDGMVCRFDPKTGEAEAIIDNVPEATEAKLYFEEDAES